MENYQVVAIAMYYVGWFIIGMMIARLCYVIGKRVIPVLIVLWGAFLEWLVSKLPAFGG